MVKGLFEKARQALKIFHDGYMTVEIIEGWTTDDDYAEMPNIVTKLKDIPCHLSFRGTSTEDQHEATNKGGDMVLFTDPSIIIPTNSKITVLQNGSSYILTNDKLKAYKSHNEYEVMEFERWSEF